MEGKLILTVETFGKFISHLIQSGVTYKLEELPNGKIEVTFTGGY